MRFLVFFIGLGYSTTALAQIPNYVPQNGLVGWWPFNGNANDESGNGNNGAVNGATLTTDRFGVVNNAYDFDGVDDSFLSNVSLNFNDDYSINCWISFKNSNPNQCFINTNPHEVMAIEFNYWSNPQSNSFSSWFGNGSNWSYYNASHFGSVLNLQNWYNILIVRLSDTVHFFLNGAEINQWIISDVTVVNASVLFGFANAFGGIEYFAGKLDDIGIWDRALTQQEIIALYNGCQLSVISQPANQTININNNAQFIISSSDPSATYQWQTDLGVGFQNLNSVGQYSGTTNDTLIVSNVTMSNNNQPFRCIITSGSCSDTSNVGMLFVDNSMTLEDQSDKSIKIYPNPAQTDFTIEVPDFVVGEKFVVLDNFGRVILKDEIKSTNQQISIQHISKGTYVITVGNQFNQILVLK